MAEPSPTSRSRETEGRAATFRAIGAGPDGKTESPGNGAATT